MDTLDEEALLLTALEDEEQECFRSDDGVDVDGDRTKSTPEKASKLTDAQKSLEVFWPSVHEDIKRIKQVDAKNQSLPLARIKKIMKLDENAKMIAAEAPLLFAKACEIFIQELTLRAWMHTEDNKRRTLQRSDIATAISRCDQFDFLIDIVPREDIKPQRKEAEPPKATTSSDQVQYYLQLAQQHQQALQNTQPTTSTTSTMVNQSMPVTGNTGVSNVQVSAPQNIMLATNPTNTTNTAQATVVNGLQNPQQQIQILQQCVTPTGEITHVPITITASQLNMLRMQMQSNANSAQSQQIIIPTIQTGVQQASLVQMAGGQQNPTGNIFLTTAQATGVDKQQVNSTTFRANC